MKTYKKNSYIKNLLRVIKIDFKDIEISEGSEYLHIHFSKPKFIFADLNTLLIYLNEDIRLKYTDENYFTISIEYGYIKHLSFNEKTNSILVS